MSLNEIQNHNNNNNNNNKLQETTTTTPTLIEESDNSSKLNYTYLAQDGKIDNDNKIEKSSILIETNKNTNKNTNNNKIDTSSSSSSSTFNIFTSNLSHLNNETNIKNNNNNTIIDSAQNSTADFKISNKLNQIELDINSNSIKNSIVIKEDTFSKNKNIKLEEKEDSNTVIKDSNQSVNNNNNNNLDTFDNDILILTTTTTTTTTTTNLPNDKLNTDTVDSHNRVILLNENKPRTRLMYPLAQQQQSNTNTSSTFSTSSTNNSMNNAATSSKVFSGSNSLISEKKDKFFINNNNNNAINYNNLGSYTNKQQQQQQQIDNSYNSAAIFHPTWDEWKRSHILETNNNNTTKKINKNSLLDNSSSNNTRNNESSEKNTTTRSIVEETYRQKSSHSSKQHEKHELQQQHQQQQQNTTMNMMNSNKQQYHDYKSKIKSYEGSDTYNPPTPIVINSNSISTSSSLRRDNNNASTISTATTTSPVRRGPRHPVYPIDGQPKRPDSPVHLSSIVLAKEPALEIVTDNFQVEPEPEPAPVQPIPEQPKKIKTIMSTQKRKDSAPNLTGWRLTDTSDSDTEIQNRLLAKASGSIPIEYISIRRDPKPQDKKPDKNKKSITTGTNTSCERGKRIASTNTNQDEIPQYNLHVSLDSLFVKSRREASTSTERKNKNAATETDVKVKDAFTECESEPDPPPPPPPPPQPEQHQFIYRSRKSRYTEWETASNPTRCSPVYRLEFLAKSPRSVSKRNYHSSRHYQTQSERHERHFNQNFEDDTDLSDFEHNCCRTRIPSQQSRHRAFMMQSSEVRADDDDRIIFGANYHEHQQQQHEYHQSSSSEHKYSCNKRSGSFPNILYRPQPVVLDNSGVTTRRYVKHTHSTNYNPPGIAMATQQHQHHHHQQHHQHQQCNEFTPLGQQYELSLLPLKLSNSCLNTDGWNQQFDNFSSKFNEIFGKQSVCQAAPKTERYYKYSRSTTDHQNQQQQVPSFGEIYHRYGNTSMACVEQQQQHQQKIRSPIIEIPVTPNSTIDRKFFSTGCNGSASTAAAGYSSYVHNQSTASSSGIGGPIPILSPTGSVKNISTAEKESVSYNNSGGNWGVSGSSFSAVQQRGFEPVNRQQHHHHHSSHSAAMSSTTSSQVRNNSISNRKLSASSLQQHGSVHGGRQEEEEELVNVVTNLDNNSERQFRPIYHPAMQTNGSTRSTPITVTNAGYAASTKSSTNNGIKQHNFSTSSAYEYSEKQHQLDQLKKQQQQQQRFYSSSQTIPN